LDLTSQVACVGDNLNDVEMVRMSALGVAMGNAHEGLKTVAKWIVRRNDDEDLPGHVIRSLQIEKDLACYAFATRRDALQAIQVWLIQAADKACKA
jgi:magnesium-transporting ATPase (P-type)